MLARRGAVRFAMVALWFTLVAALGCEKSAPGPSTADFTEQREALKARVAKNQANKPTAAPRVAPAIGASTAGASEASFGAVGTNYVYDPTGKRDPFRNFTWERPDRLREQELHGPLEQFDLGQFSLVAVVWKTGTARALVQDPSGMSYIVGEGSRIGRNEGRVISIDDGLMIVKETYVDYLGQETTKDIEMRMRRNEGG